MSLMSYHTPPAFFIVDGNVGRNIYETSAPYQELYRAAHRGDWKTTESILQQDPNQKVAALNVEEETVLHVAVGTGKAIGYVQKLLTALQRDDLKRVDVYGQTPLMVATIIGNIDAAKLLVHKNPDLLYIGDVKELLPVHRAAQYGQKEILLYLLKVTSCVDPFPYSHKLGSKLLSKLLVAEFYDVATSLIKRFPQLVDESFTGGHSSIPPLTKLATNPSAFRGRGFWMRLIYACIPTKWQISYDNYSIGLATRGNNFLLEQSHSSLKIVRYLTSIFEHIRPTKSKRHQAIQFVKCFCMRASISSLLTHEMFKEPFLLAAESGIVEIVEELAETFPNLLWVQNDKKQNIFQVAVLNRHQRVYDLYCRVAKDKRSKTRKPDADGNNILHMAGKLAPLHRLDMVSGAALKMRYELQWFKKVEKSAQPFQKLARNNQQKTPKELFTEEHKELVIEGEKWMKCTANSCTTPAALIATVVFAAAVTVPMSKIGRPGEEIFTVFAVADALSLFTSLSSLLMFVSILTSRYTQDAFLISLPLRILVGLFMLLVSISSMMVAFSMILFLTFGNHKKWVLGTVVAAACVPPLLFVILEYSLLVDMIFYRSFPQISGTKGGGRHPLYTRTRYRNIGINGNSSF